MAVAVVAVSAAAVVVGAKDSVAEVAKKFRCSVVVVVVAAEGEVVGFED